jgi:PAS domain S-box-containing protein
LAFQQAYGIRRSLEANMPTGNDRIVFLSTRTATRRDDMLALAVVGVSSLLFALAVPFAGMPLTPIPAFVASCQSALAITGLITAILLFSQFAIVRSWAMLLLASGYLFAAATAIVHGLTFPGLFAPSGLLGAGPQTAAWLFMISHGGFPLLVIGYAVTKGEKCGIKMPWPAGRSIAASVLAVGMAVAIVTWVVTAQHERLPALLSQGRYTPTSMSVATSVWLLGIAALVTLWFRRPHLVIDIWLMVVLCAWLFDIALGSVLNVAEFDLGFYAGRIYGLCAASVLLGVLLFDNVALRAAMARLPRTERGRAEAERGHHPGREQLFSAVVESANVAIIAKALDGTVTAWNTAAERLFGYPASEAVGKHIAILVQPDQRCEVDGILARVGRGEAVQDFETVRLRKDGQKVEVSLSVSPIRAASGEIIGASEIARDITESKRTLRALSHEIEERQQIFENSQDLILISDTAGNVLQVSPSVATILGYRPDEMIGHNAIEFINPQDLDLARKGMRAARSGRQIHSFEMRYNHKSGRPVTLNWLGTWSERARRYYFIGRDLTDIHAAEAQFRQVQKMDAIGQLTGGVAHDFNNILTVITGTIGVLAEAVADRPELASIAKLIDEAAERGAQLTKHLLAFARKQPLRPCEVDVNALLLESAKLLRPALGEQIEIVPKLAEDAWPALVDPNQLSSAILNLALNARDAMPRGGKLVLETANVALDDVYVSMNDEVATGDYVMIATSDTGCGIPAVLLDKVFDPFFTTKDVGKGTGLGLSMVFGFVKQSGGHIKIYSEEGHGTTVKIYLPRSTGTGQTAADAEPAKEIQGGHETVLIVEDDALVRKHVVTQVTSLGYKTLEAADAAEALAIIDNGTAIDLLFTDVIMPGTMNGRQLVKEALKRRPTLKTLFTSGYTENAVIHHGRLDPDVLLLAKPYRKLELARMIRLALGG